MKTRNLLQEEHFREFCCALKNILDLMTCPSWQKIPNSSFEATIHWGSLKALWMWHLWTWFGGFVVLGEWLHSMVLKLLSNPNNFQESEVRRALDLPPGLSEWEGTLNPETIRASLKPRETGDSTAVTDLPSHVQLLVRGS